MILGVRRDKAMDILEYILFKEKSVMDCHLAWNEKDARKYSDESQSLFMTNPDLCNPDRKLYAFHL